MLAKVSYKGDYLAYLIIRVPEVAVLHFPLLLAWLVDFVVPSALGAGVVRYDGSVVLLVVVAHVAGVEVVPLYEVSPAYRAFKVPLSHHSPYLSSKSFNSLSYSPRTFFSTKSKLVS